MASPFGRRGARPSLCTYEVSRKCPISHPSMLQTNLRHQTELRFGSCNQTRIATGVCLVEFTSCFDHERTQLPLQRLYGAFPSGDDREGGAAATMFSTSWRRCI